jgi:beta-lysine 5,6-aminomutase beta subunit
MTPVDPSSPKLLRAYGDRRGDGMVQLAFVLEIAPSSHARAVAKQFAVLHGLRDPLVATMEACVDGLTYFVVYGHSEHSVDPATIDVRTVTTAPLSRDELEHRVAARLGRKIVVVGACTGSDAHTVGIDAILNYKGYGGDKGLESYPCFEAHNLGSQVENDVLAERAIALKADAVLVSQIVTQRDCHKENAAALIELAKRQGWRSRIAMLLGGPRVDHGLALDLGYDAGFGPGTTASAVASFLVEWVCNDRPRGSRAPPAGEP